MRILYHHRTQGAGVERIHIIGLTNALRTKGHDVQIVSPPGVTLESGTSHSKTKRSLLGGFAKYATEFLFELAEIAYNVLSFFRLKKELQHSPYDLLYERYALYSLSAAFLSDRLMIPFVLEVNDATFVDRVRPLSFQKLAVRFERYIFAKADVIITISKNLEKMIVAMGVDNEKVHVLPNAVDPSLFVNCRSSQDLRQQLDLKKGHKVLGFVGKVVPWHGLDLLLGQLDSLIEFDRNLRLLIVGDCSHSDLIVKQDLEPYIVFTGEVPYSQVPSYLDVMDIVILPHSNDYGSPMKLFEYMASGRIVVAPDLGPIREIIDHGVHGILFEAGNSTDMVDAICHGLRIIDSDMGQRAKNKVFSEHTWQNNAEAVLSLYSKITAKVRQVGVVSDMVQPTQELKR